MKKDFNKRKYTLSVGIILLLSQLMAISNDFFENNLLKVDVCKTSLDGIKIILYTKKPYKEVVSVNKKNDSQYVILLPETASSITSKPSLGNTSDVVQNIEVKTQQLSGAYQKGYTKITISTIRPIEIIPQSEVLSVSEYKVSEEDYKELLAQAKKKPIAEKATAPASTSKSTKKAEPVKKETLATKKPLPKTSKASKPVIKKQAAAVSKPKPKVATVTTQKTVELKPETKPSTPVKIQPIQQKEAIQSPVTAPQPPIAKPEHITPQKVEMPPPETPVQKIIRIIKSNLTIFAGGALLIPLVLLLILIKKGKKTASQINEKSQEQEIIPNIESPTEVIEDELTEEELPTEEEIILTQEEHKTDKKEEIDTLFSQETVNDILTKEHQKQTEETIGQDFSQEIIEKEELTEEFSEKFAPSDETFEEIPPILETEILPLENIEQFEDITLPEAEEFENIEEEKEDKQKTVHETFAETFETNIESEEDAGIEAETEPESKTEFEYNPIEQEEISEETKTDLSENADLNEFLQIKEEAYEPQEIIESKASENDPEEIDLDTLSFENNTFSEEIQAEDLTTLEILSSQEEIFEEKEQSSPEEVEELESLKIFEEIPKEETSKMIETTPLEEFQTEEILIKPEKEEELIEELFEHEEEAFAEEENTDTINEEEAEKRENELLLNSLGLKSRSEFAIDCEKGFHLVDFEGATALIGYINEEIFVLKRFNQAVKAPLQVRLSERKTDKEDYMVKAGSFKAIIEVSPYNMELVIEL